MAKRPVFAPRRDEIALGKGGAFSQRSITYLENLSELTNEAPQDIEDNTTEAIGGNSQSVVAMAQGVKTAKVLNDALNLLAAIQSDGGVSNATIKELSKPISDLLNTSAAFQADVGSLNAKTKELSKPIADLFNTVAELISMTGSLSAENKNIRKEIEDLKQLHGGL